MKKFLAILLALVLVAGMLAVPTLADEEPACTVYRATVSTHPTTDEYQNTKAAFDPGTETWRHADEPNSRYLFVELSGGWEFDMDYLNSPAPFADDSTVDFRSVEWVDGYDEQDRPVFRFGKTVTALTLDGTDGLQDGGEIHFRPRVVKGENEAYLDIRINVEYQLWFGHRYWNWDDYDHTMLEVCPGAREIIKVFNGGSDVSNSVTLVDSNSTAIEESVATLKPIVDGENGNEEEESEGWYELLTFGSFDGYIKWQSGDEVRLLSLRCALPQVGFYTSSIASDEALLNYEYQLKDDNKPIYLILNEDDPDVTLELNGKREEAWIEWIEKESGKVWAIDLDGSKFEDWENIFVNYDIVYSQYDYRRGDHIDIRVLNATPGLRFCWPDWDQNGLVPRLDDPDRLSQNTSTPAPGGCNVQLVMLDYDSEGDPQITPLTKAQIAQITMSENGAGFVKLAAAEDDDNDPNNDYAYIEVSKWLEGEEPVAFTYNGYSVYLYTWLPEFGFYSTPTPSKESYLGEWIYDGTEDTETVYYAYFGNWLNVNINGWNINRPDDVRIDVEHYNGRDDVLVLRTGHSDSFDYHLNIDIWGNFRDGGFDRHSGIHVLDRTASLWWDDNGWARSDLFFDVPQRELGSWYVEFDNMWLQTREEHEDNLPIPDQTIKNEKGDEILKLEHFANGKYHVTALGYGDGALEYERNGVTYRLPVSIQKQVILKAEEVYAKKGSVAEVTITPQDDLDFSALALVVEYDDQYLEFEEAENGSTFKTVGSSAEEQAAVEEGDNLFIYNTETKRLIWMPSAAENQTSVTAKGGVPLATLKFRVANVPDEDIGTYANIQLDRYHGENNDEWDGDYSYIADASGRREALNIRCDSGFVKILDHTPGDVNGDDKVNMQDVTAMLRWHVGYNDAGIQENALDTDGDDMRNLWDVTWLMRYLSGWNNIVLQ